MNSIYLYGAGGHAKVILDILKSDPKYTLIYNGINVEENNAKMTEMGNLNIEMPSSCKYILHVGSFRKEKIVIM